MRRKMESLVRSSFLDACYPVDDFWHIATVQRLYNLQLASAYRYCPAKHKTHYSEMQAHREGGVGV